GIHAEVHSFLSLIVQCLVRTLPVVKTKVGFQIPNRVQHTGIVLQVNLFVLDGTPQPLGENVVQRAATSIHADQNAGILQAPSKLGTGELGALIGIEDLGLRFLQSPV